MVIPMAGTKLVGKEVAETVTVLVPEVVAALAVMVVAGTKERLTFAPPVAPTERVTVVPEMAVMVVPAVMPVPLTPMPTTRPLLLGTVIDVKPDVGLQVIISSGVSAKPPLPLRTRLTSA